MFRQTSLTLTESYIQSKRYIMQWVVQSKVFLILCCSLFLTNLSSALATSSSSKPDPIDQLNSTAAWEGNCIVACDRSSLSFSGTYLHREERNQNKGIAFSAIRNEDNLYELPQPNSKVVIFDYVPVNLGNAYNKQTSEFTASVSGVFKFDFSVIKHFSRESLTVAMTVSNLLL